MIRPPPRSTPFPYPTLFQFSRICDALRDGQEKLPLPAQKLATSRTEIRRCLNAGEEVVFGESGKNFSEMGKCRSRRQATLSHRSEEHTSELQSQSNLVCRLL